MADAPFFPQLPDGWEPTRATLHAYAHGASAVARSLAPQHPKWWHASLKVSPTGLTSDSVPIPAGGALQVRMDLVDHAVVVEASNGDSHRIDMAAGATGTGLADEVIAAAARLGVEGEYARDKFENDDERVYDPAHVERFWSALTNAAQVLEAHRRTLPGSPGPLQVWPHGFDLAFEWFGTKTETYEENGEVAEHAAQLNFGFYPGGDAYFYANPWPFEESLTETSLPHDAAWHTEGWQGTMYRYADLAERDDGADRVRSYLSAVYEVASPTLMT